MDSAKSLLANLSVPLRINQREFLMKEFSRIFGLSSHGQMINILKSVKIPTRGLVFITGPSGSGKTSILKFITKRYPDCCGLPKIPPRKTALSLIPGSISNRISWLGHFGLAEARLMVTRYGELSEGQKIRTQLAVLMWRRPQLIVIDEFLSVLDRLTAKIVAFNLQKVLRRFKCNAFLASSQDDLIEPLGPDFILRLDLNCGYKVEANTGNRIPMIREAKSIVIRPGSPKSYLKLARFHYIDSPTGISTSANLDFLGTVDQIIVASLGKAEIAVRLAGSPFCTALNTVPLIKYLNKAIVVIYRTIVHPSFRGIGITKLLEPKVSGRTICLLSCSALGLHFPFYTGAGFTKIKHPRSRRYPEHAELEHFLKQLSKDLCAINDYHQAQEFFNGLNKTDAIRVKRIVTKILIRTNLDYCLFLAKLARIDVSDSVLQHLENFYRKSIQQIEEMYFGELLSEAMYFPVQGFVRYT